MGTFIMDPTLHLQWCKMIVILYAFVIGGEKRMDRGVTVYDTMAN